MQNEIIQACDLLNANGDLAVKGYAKKMNIRYNREQAKQFPMPLKEWNFYQIQKDHLVLQLTLGHVSYICSIAATLMDLHTGDRYEFSVMKPLFIPELDRNPETDSNVSFTDKDFLLNFTVTKDKRILQVSGKSEKYANVDIHIELDNDVNNEKMVIATPFRKPHQFYLNYKENYYSGTGHATYGDTTVSFDGCTALLDWGRGIWPYSHEWFWGNLTSEIEGIPFGFNIGWGFGDLSKATENMFFYNRKAYKLGHLSVTRNEQDYLAPWTFRDSNGLLEMTLEPFYDNYTENKYLVVDTHCNQIFGYFSGTILTEDGPKQFRKKLACVEHAVNRW